MKLLKLLFSLLSFGPIHLLAQNKLSYTQQSVKLQNGLSFKLSILSGYRIAAVAQGLKRPRFFAKAPDGRLFVTDMQDRSDNKNGKLLILQGWNEHTKSFDSVTTYLSKLHNPNQAEFYFDGKQHWLYVAETGKLMRYAFIPGDNKPHDNGTVIARFPDYGLSYKYGGWHLTRSLTFHQNKLYVSVGSSCNACLEKEKVRATVLEMNPDGSNVEVFVSGLRNAVDIQWVGDSLWATNMGRDLIGPEKPQDQLIHLKRGTNYGWPFYYQYNQTIEADGTFRDSSKPLGFKPPPIGFVGFKAHSAPLGLVYVQQFSDAVINQHFLVALHGSTSVWRKRGNEIVLITGRDKYVPFVTGFLQGETEDKRFGRPCDILQWDNRSLFISDDKHGVIYYIWKE